MDRHRPCRPAPLMPTAVVALLGLAGTASTEPLAAGTVPGLAPADALALRDAARADRFARTVFLATGLPPSLLAPRAPQLKRVLGTPERALALPEIAGALGRPLTRAEAEVILRADRARTNRAWRTVCVCHRAASESQRAGGAPIVGRRSAAPCDAGTTASGGDDRRRRRR